jgi:hypothetical protein
VFGTVKGGFQVFPMVLFLLTCWPGKWWRRRSRTRRPTRASFRGVIPPVHVREALAVSRRAGVPFEEAWPSALTLAVSDRTAHERRVWQMALAGTRDGWERP